MGFVSPPSRLRELALSLRTWPYICTWEWQVNQVWYVPRYVRPWYYNIVCTIIKYNLMANKEKQVINKSWLKHTFCKVKIVWDHYGFPKIKLERHYLGIPNLYKLNNAQPSVYYTVLIHDHCNLFLSKWWRVRELSLCTGI